MNMTKIEAGKYRLVIVDDYQTRGEFSCPDGILLGLGNSTTIGVQEVKMLVRI